jgi:hypothetical protein
MGNQPINKEELQDFGEEDLLRDGNGLEGLDPNSEEYIMKFVMLESMKMHEDEERKRKEESKEGVSEEKPEIE